MKVRTNLILLVVGTLTPALIFAAVMFVLFSRHQIVAQEKNLIAFAQSYSSNIDRELTSGIRTLQGLATSQNLDSENLTDFYKEAVRFQKAFSEWEAVSMSDPAGQQLLNTRRPFGSSLPLTGVPSLINEIVRTRRPAVSDLFVGAILKTPLIGFGVPVIRNGKLKYVLAASAAPAFLLELQSQTNLQKDWLISVLDKHEVIITRNFHEPMGQTVQTRLAANGRKVGMGAFELATVGNGSVATALHRSELSGWTVAVGVPITVLQSPVLGSLMITGFAGIIFLLTGIPFAIILGRRIVTPLTALSTSIEAIADGKTIFSVHSSIVEIESTAQALEKAASVRLQAEQSVRENEERLRVALASARMVSWDFEAATKRITWSGPLSALFGPQTDSFGGRLDDFLALAHPDDRKAAALSIEHSMQEGGDYELTYRTVWPDGTIHWLAASGRTFLEGTTGRAVRMTGVVRDITEQRRAAEELTARNQALHWLHEISQEILASQRLKIMPKVILDKALLVGSCDLGIIRLFDRATGLLEPVASQGYNDPEIPNRHRKTLENGTTDVLVQAVKSTIIQNRLQNQPGVQNFKKEGIESLITVPVYTDDHVLGVLQLGSRTLRTFQPELISLLETLGHNLGIAVQMNNLLEDALGNQTRLQNFARKMVEVQEIERRHIARELHDEIGQELTGLKLSLGVAARLAPGLAKSRLDDAADLIDDLVAKVRNFSLRLRPPMLDDLGLLPTLLWHFKIFSTQTNIRVNFQHDLGTRFSTDLEATAYRIVQESLTNAARHAEVNEISVRIVATTEVFRIEIQDQGTGFDLTTITQETAGLTGMRERAASVGGRLTVLSALGAGTTVIAEFPLEEECRDFPERGSIDV